LPFMDAIEKNSTNPLEKLLVETAKKVKPTEFDLTRYAAIKGIMTVIASGAGENTPSALAKAGLVAIGSIPEEIIYKKARGVTAAQPFIDAIEANSENITDKLLVETAKKIEPSEFDQARYAAYKNVLKTIGS